MGDGARPAPRPGPLAAIADGLSQAAAAAAAAACNAADHPNTLRGHVEEQLRSNPAASGIMRDGVWYDAVALALGRTDCAASVEALEATAAGTWAYPATLVPQEGAVGWLAPPPSLVWGRKPASQLYVPQHAAQQALAAAHKVPLDLGALLDAIQPPVPAQLQPTLPLLSQSSPSGGMGAKLEELMPQRRALPLPQHLASLDLRCIADPPSGLRPLRALTALTLLQLRAGAALSEWSLALPNLASLDLWCQDCSRAGTASWAPVTTIPRALPPLASALTRLTSLTLRELPAAVEPPAAVTALTALPLLESLSVELVYGESWDELVAMISRDENDFFDLLGDGDRGRGNEGPGGEGNAAEESEGTDRADEGEGSEVEEGCDGGQEDEARSQTLGYSEASTSEAASGGAAAPVQAAGSLKATIANLDTRLSKLQRSMDAMWAGHKRLLTPVRQVFELGCDVLDSLRPMDLFSGFAASDGSGDCDRSRSSADGASGDLGVGTCCFDARRPGGARRGLTHLDVSFLGAGLLPGAWHGIAALGGSLRSLALRVARCPREEGLLARLQRDSPDLWSPDAFWVDSLDRLPHLTSLTLDAPLSDQLAADLRRRALPPANPPHPPSPQHPPPQQQEAALVSAAPQLQNLAVHGLWHRARIVTNPNTDAAATPQGGCVPAADQAGPSTSSTPSPICAAPLQPPRLLLSLTLDGNLAELVVPALAAGALSGGGGAGCLMTELRLAHRPAGRPAARWLPLRWAYLPPVLRALELEGFTVDLPLAQVTGSDQLGRMGEAASAVEASGQALRELSSAAGGDDTGGVSPPTQAQTEQQQCLPRLERLRVRHCAAHLGGLSGSPLAEAAFLGCFLLAGAPTATLPMSTPAAAAAPPVAEATDALHAGAAEFAAPWDATAQLRRLRRQPWFGRLLRLDLQLASPLLAAGGSVPGVLQAGGSGADGCGRADGSDCGTGLGGGCPQLEHLNITWEAAALAQCSRRSAEEEEEEEDAGGRREEHSGRACRNASSHSGSHHTDGHGYGLRGSGSASVGEAAARSAGPDAAGPSAAPLHRVPVPAHYLGLSPSYAQELVSALPSLRSLELCVGDAAAPAPLRVEELMWLLRLRGLRRLRLVLCASDGAGSGSAGAAAPVTGGAPAEPAPASAWLHSELADLLLRGLPYCQSQVLQLRVA